MRVLLIDDDLVILRKIKNQLERQSWQVDVANTAEKARSKMESKEFDVIICDHHLSPNADAEQGLDLIIELRESGMKTPVIILTGRRYDEITPERALDAGVDDFIKKPYRLEELLARARAVVRRQFNCESNTTNLIHHNGITLDLNLQKVTVDGKEVHLGNILFLLLQKFLQRSDILLTYEMLIDYVWGKKNAFREETKNTLRVHMTHLKKALGAKYAAHIRTVHGIGYVWETEKEEGLVTA